MIMDKNLMKQSKFLSLVLRHQPDAIGITLDDQGWVDVEELLTKAQAHGRNISRDQLKRIVDENDKKRFAFSEDGLRIRANQGHSVDVDLALPPTEPPKLLYHGTAKHNLESIRRSGLHSGNRQHVHLSKDLETAIKVGQRHGVPVVLTVRAGDMHAAGHLFYLAANGVWLAESVPVEFLEIPE
jgi:putative RNA 2'-phosphotransferase